MASNLDVVERIAQRLFVGGGDHVQAMVAAVTESLPAYIDDLTRDLGPDVYERMQNDTSVSSAVETRRLSVVSAPIQVTAAGGADAEDPNDARNLTAVRRREEIAAGSLDLRSAADEIWDGLLYGIKHLEIQLMPRDGKLVPKSAVGLDAKSYVIVQGRDGDFLGIAPNGILTPELDRLLREGHDDEATRNYWRRIVPAWKLLALSNRPRNGRIIGRSILRPAYQPWFGKTTLVPEYLKHLARFGSPSVVGKLPQNMQELTVKKDADGLPVTDDNGAPVLENAVLALFMQLLAWRNGSVLSVPHGTEVDVLWPQGNGASFIDGYELFKREIHEAILGTAQATTEARAESRSSKDVAQDVVGLRVADDRLAIGAALTPLLRLLTLVNDGERALAMSPTVVLADIEQQDFAAVGETFERLQRTPGALLPSMRTQFWAKMGLKWDEAELAEDLASMRTSRDANQAAGAELNELFDPEHGSGA